MIVWRLNVKYVFVDMSSINLYNLFYLYSKKIVFYEQATQI